MALEQTDKQWIAEQITASETRVMERLTEVIRNVETTLLTEFHKWASPKDQRIRSHSEALRAVDLEIEALDYRVRKLEGR